jgi:hypothetical protein
VCPINISEIHFQDIASTQSQSRQQQNRCSIPQSDGGVPIAGSDDALDIGRWQVARQRRKAPRGNGRHCIVHSGPTHSTGN